MSHGLGSERPKLLVVDDVGTGRIVLKTMLSRYAHVDTADSGESAIAAYRKAVAADQMYDLIFLDIVMPGMDGIAVLKEIRRIEREGSLPATAVAMTTALDQSQYVRAALDSDAVGYLVKPLGVQAVVELLTRLKLIGG